MSSSASSLATSAVKTPDNGDVFPRPKPAHANLRTTDDKNTADSLSFLIKDAAKSAYGKQGAAAAQLEKNEGNFSRDIDAERLTLADLRALGPVFLVAMAKGLLDEYGPLVTPQARARQLLVEQRRISDELFALIEHLGERTA